MPLFLILLLVPLIEIGLFIEVGDRIGLMPTLGIVIVTAIVGAFAIRMQGRQALRQMTQLSNPRQAGSAMLNGVMIGAAGLLLLTPGILTDTIGLLLLVPPVRKMIEKRIVSRFVFAGMTTGTEHGGSRDYSADAYGGAGHGPQNPANSDSPSTPRAPVGKPTPTDADDAVILDDSDKRT